MKKILAIALVLVLALSFLTACGGDDTSGGGNTPSGNSSTTPPTSQGGNDTTPSNNGGDEKGYPAGWPNEVPKMDGNVIDGSIHDSDGNISGTATLDGVSKNNVDDYINTLKSNGFKIDSEQDMANLGMFLYQLSKEKCTVNLTYTTDDNQVIISLIKTK